MFNEDELNPRKYSLIYAITTVKLVATLPNIKELKVELEQFFLPNLFLSLNRYSKSEELLYWSSSLLFCLGKLEHIRLLLIPFVEKHSDCAWAWTFLGRALMPLDEEIAIGCICKAVLSPPCIQFQTDPMIELALGLTKKGMPYSIRFLPENFYEEIAPLAEKVFDFALVG